MAVLSFFIDLLGLVATSIDVSRPVDGFILLLTYPTRLTWIIWAILRKQSITTDHNLAIQLFAPLHFHVIM